MSESGAKTNYFDSLVRDAFRYRAIKDKINYQTGMDGIAWATMEWCVEVESFSPSDLDAAIDDILLANAKLTIDRSALLAAWREYSGNPHTTHPCENFKAGWVAANLSNDEEAICNSESIKEGCRRFRC